MYTPETYRATLIEGNNDKHKHEAEITHNVSSKQTQTVSISSNTSVTNSDDRNGCMDGRCIMEVNTNLKEEVSFLRREVEAKNDLINSLQKIINVLVSDQHHINQHHHH